VRPDVGMVGVRSVNFPAGFFAGPSSELTGTIAVLGVRFRHHRDRRPNISADPLLDAVARG